MSKRKGTTPFHLLLLPLALIGVAGLYFTLKPGPLPTPPSRTELAKPPLAPLGSTPDWSLLEPFQETISRELFLERLTSVYTKGEGWDQWISVRDNHAVIKTGAEPFTLRFAPKDQQLPRPSVYWKKSQQLEGLHVAIDPGHIGGDYAVVEERHLQYGDHSPIREGSMTLLAAQHLATLLRQKGALVSLVRNTNEPITSERPSDFKNLDRKTAEKLFYRTSEIRARADKVNDVIQPDLVLCLHYNASGSPVPLPGQNFHILVNGTYHESELKHLDERFDMLRRLLSRTIETELPLAKHIAESFVAATALPAYEYRPDHPFSTRLSEYVWARNLLANRLYQCPVVFLEPYIMNSPDFIIRHEAGDYEGFRMVDGKPRRSIYREYAHAVAEGVESYFAN
ncbi:MAG: N-acetylmuramoyl-L-alanine amidase family protein [Verrucomicrobiaceae bacterium]